MSCSTTLSLLLFVSSLLPSVFAIVPGSDNWAQQGFYFDWNNATSPLPTSITGQCENINIKWYRGTGVGPDPVAPYVFKIYSSMHINPFIVNAGSQLEAKLPIPFDPYSRYILCMTDSTGISGGCQDLYTVYPTGNTTCTNFTMPADILGVRMTSIETGGSLSRFGWPARCSDLQFDLEAGVEGGIVGTPPYTLTVAPALRTPVNITFEKTVRWTIMLDHGHPFFVSIVDSKGVTWSNGPLHAGAGTLSCFGPPRPYPWLTLASSLGMSFSFLAIGILLASTICLWHNRRRPQFIQTVRDPGENSRIQQQHLTSTVSQDSKSRISTNTRQEEAHMLRTRTGSTSPATVPARTSLHLRRPSNTKAPSSEIGLMKHRPSFRREETSGTIDLDASPTDEVQHTFPPVPARLGNPQPFRREIDPMVIEPWTQTNESRGYEPSAEDERRGSITTSRPPLKHRDTSNSTSSGIPSPTASGGGTLGPTASLGLSSNAGRPNIGSNIGPAGRGLSTLPRTGEVTMTSPQTFVPTNPIPRPQQYAYHLPSSASHSNPQTTQPSNTSNNQQPQPQPPHEVYVVHHDAGLPPPVTVITHHGTVVTELPPGYDHLIPTPQPPNLNYHGESGGMEEHDASTSMRRLKNQPSTSAMTNVDPQIQLQIQRPGGSGLALVHAEDVPLSAVSPTSPNPNTFPLPPPLPSQSIRTAETHLPHS